MPRRPGTSPRHCAHAGSTTRPSRRSGAVTCCASGRRRKRWPGVADLRGIALATLFLLAAAAPAAAADIAGIDAAIDATVERYDLPGIAVGVIVDGEVAHVRTAGETVAGTG